jgi:predicted Kef-type K+ transport protein
VVVSPTPNLHTVGLGFLSGLFFPQMIAFTLHTSFIYLDDFFFRVISLSFSLSQIIHKVVDLLVPSSVSQILSSLPPLHHGEEKRGL